MSSPLLKGSVLLSQQKGAVEEAPNDGYSYARFFDGSDYDWTSRAHFHADFGGKTQGTFDLYTQQKWAVAVENIGGEAQLLLKSSNDTGQFISGMDDVYEMYMGWYGSNHPTAPQKWEMVANGYTFFDATYTSAKSIFVDTTGAVGIGQNPPATRLHVAEDATSGDVVVATFDAQNASGGRLQFLSDVCADAWRINWGTGATDKFEIAQLNSGKVEFGLRPGVAGVGGSCIIDVPVGIQMSTAPAKPLHVIGNDGAAAYSGSGTSASTLLLANNANCNIELVTNASNNAQILAYRAGETSNYCRLHFNGTAGSFGIYTGNGTATSTEKVVVLNNGKVGIGNSAPNHRLNVHAADNLSLKLQFTNALTGTTTTDGFEVGISDSSSNAIVWQRENAYLRFGTNNTERVRIEGDGGFHLQEKSAKGSSVTAQGQLWVKDEDPNTLWFVDDGGQEQRISVKEGTWTPTFQDASFSDAEGQTYTTQSGYYWLHGGICYIWFDCGINSIGTLTGTDACTLANLPFTASYGNFTINCCYGSSLAITAGTTVTGRILGSTTRAVMQVWSGTAGTGSMSINQLSAGGRLIGNGWYRVAYTD